MEPGKQDKPKHGGDWKDNLGHFALLHMCMQHIRSPLYIRQVDKEEEAMLYFPV